MSNPMRTYRILILPQGRVAATRLALNEAAAWIATYNAIMEDQPLRAVVDEEAAVLAEPRGVAISLKTPPLRGFRMRQPLGTKRAA